MKPYRLSVLIVLSLSFTAAAVSRVGGGTLSNDENMFSTVRPADFLATVINDNGDVQLTSKAPVLGGFQNGFPIQRQNVQVMMLSNVRPDLLTLNDRTAMIDLFASGNWIRRRHPVACVEWFEETHGNALTSTLVWGGGRGVVMTGFSTGPTAAAVEDMSMQLTTSGCGWN